MFLSGLYVTPLLIITEHVSFMTVNNYGHFMITIQTYKDIKEKVFSIIDFYNDVCYIVCVFT